MLFEDKVKIVYQRVKEALHKPYRVALMDFETLSESRQYVFKPLTLLLGGLVVFVVLVGGTAALIVLTPLREHIPGYFRPEYSEEMVALQNELQELKRAVQSQEAVMPALQPLGDGKSGDATKAMSAIEQTQQTVQTEGDDNPAQAAIPNSVRQAPRLRMDALKVANTAPMMSLLPPVNGQVSREFNYDNRHYGVDIVADGNSLIVSAIEGSVVFADYSDQDGYIIGIAGKNNIVTFYKHNSRLLKGIGSHVQRGEAIAVIGNSGENSTGPHLHFEIWNNGVPVNPTEYMSF